MRYPSSRLNSRAVNLFKQLISQLDHLPRSFLEHLATIGLVSLVTSEPTRAAQIISEFTSVMSPVEGLTAASPAKFSTKTAPRNIRADCLRCDPQPKTLSKDEFGRRLDESLATATEQPFAF